MRTAIHYVNKRNEVAGQYCIIIIICMVDLHKRKKKRKRNLLLPLLIVVPKHFRDYCYHERYLEQREVDFFLSTSGTKLY